MLKAAFQLKGVLLPLVQVQPPPVTRSMGAEAAGQVGAWGHQSLGWKEVLQNACTVQVPAADANSS